MEERVIIYFILAVLILILSEGSKMCFAQEIPFTPRENIIFTTLNQLQEREGAIIGAMQEAQLKLAESEFMQRPAPIERESFSFKKLVSHTHPYLTISNTFNDNVDSQVHRKSSITNTITPGLKMNLLGKGKSLNLDTHIDNTYYNNRSRSNFQGATVDILSNFGIGRYTLSISDLFSNRLSSSELGTATNGVTYYYWKNSFASALGRHFNRIGFDLGYNRVDYDYESTSGLANDRTEEIFSFNQYLRVATKTQVLFEYSHGRTKYRHTLVQPKDIQYNDYTLGATGVLSSKVTGLVKVGQRMADPKAGDNYRDTTLTGNLGYRISNRSDMAFLLKHVIHATYQQPVTHSDNYIRNDFSVTANHRLAFNPKFRLSLGYKADRYDYPKKVDSDSKTNTYTLSFGLTYAFRRWLDFSLNYSNTKVASNIRTEYKKNTVTFKTQARF